jgi:Raf kinase inhibitor-like YbhB/YbcL family protein
MEGARNKTSEDQLHWLVWNIPATTNVLPEGVPMGDLKDGSRQTSATGNGVYRGPGAPANGPYHHYVFEIFALDTKVDIPANPTDPFDTRAKVLAAMQGHVLGKAVYLGFFRRPQ